MPDKLILVPEAILVQDPEIIDDNGIVKGPAPGKPVFFKGLNILKKPKCSGPTDFPNKSTP